MSYYKVFINSLKSKREMFQYDTPDYFKERVEFVLANKKEWYESIFIYTDKEKEHLELKGSLAGISGLSIDRVVFDFDSKQDVQLALDDARTLVSRLSFIPEEAIQCYFSSNKGFHVQINIAAFINKEEFIKIVEHYALDLSTFDQVIKDDQRVFRFPMSFNPKSGMYKIPMTAQELLTTNLEDIMAVAKAPIIDDRLVVLYGFQDIEMPQEFIDVMSAVEEKLVVENVYDNDDYILADTPDMTQKPDFLTAAKYVLHQGYFEPGERNEACLILCATYKFLKFSKEHAFNSLKATLDLRQQRIGSKDGFYDEKELWTTVVEKVYSPAWQGGVYSEKDSPLLKKTIERYDLTSQNSFLNSASISINEMGERFVDFANNIEKNTIKTGIDEIDQNVLITTSMMVGLLGAPSSGKTTLAINFLENQSMNNIGSFFVSADMGDQLVFARLMQRYCGISFKEILHSIKNVEMSQWRKPLKDAWDLVMTNFKNVGFSFTSGPSIVEISNRIDAHEQATGNKVKVLVVDYLEKLRCDYSDATAASGYNASRLADLTRDKQIATILLLQPQKSAGDPSDELTSMRKIKGASIIEQDCRVILSTWRPGFNPDVKGFNTEDRYTSIAVVKNNMGGTNRMDFSWDGLKGRIQSLDENGAADLERVRQEAYERKQAKLNGTMYQSESDEQYARNTSGGNKNEWTNKYKRN